jgi:hypothetical protein
MVDHGLTINHGFWLVFGQTMVFSTIAALCFAARKASFIICYVNISGFCFLL